MVNFFQNKRVMDKDMDTFCIVDISGGLGNQLFQYAFGRAFQEKNGIDVFFNDEYFRAQEKVDERWNANGIYHSNNLLSIFNLPVTYANKSQLEYIKTKNSSFFSACSLVKFFKRLFKLPIIVNGEMIENCPQRFYPHFLNNYSFMHYTGCYQNEKYFKAIEEIIRKEFVFPKFDENDEHNLSAAEKIASCNNPVFIHVRRGDYINLGWNIASTDYYKKACDYMKKNVPDAEFFVFSDDIDFIKNEFDIGYPFKIIENVNFANGVDYKDMQLMTYFKHAIIANSSFSWWGAWLMQNKNKIVLAPKPWFPLSDLSFNINQIICDDWIGIEYQA